MHVGVLLTAWGELRRRGMVLRTTSVPPGLVAGRRATAAPAPRSRGAPRGAPRGATRGAKRRARGAFAQAPRERGATPAERGATPAGAALEPRGALSKFLKSAAVARGPDRLLARLSDGGSGTLRGRSKRSG